MKYSDDVLGFGEALRIVLSGGRAARRIWEKGCDVEVGPRLADALAADAAGMRACIYPAGSYIFLAPGSAREVYEKPEGGLMHAGRGMHLLVHRPGETPVNRRWALDSSELFAADWCEVLPEEETADGIVSRHIPRLR